MPWAAGSHSGLLIFPVHAVEGVVKEVLEHAKEAGEKGKKVGVRGAGGGVAGEEGSGWRSQREAWVGVQPAPAGEPRLDPLAGTEASRCPAATREQGRPARADQSPSFPWRSHGDTHPWQHTHTRTGPLP